MRGCKFGRGWPKIGDGHYPCVLALRITGAVGLIYVGRSLAGVFARGATGARGLQSVTARSMAVSCWSWLLSSLLSLFFLMFISWWCYLERWAISPRPRACFC